VRADLRRAHTRAGPGRGGFRDRNNERAGEPASTLRALIDDGKVPARSTTMRCLPTYESSTGAPFRPARRGALHHGSAPRSVRSRSARTYGRRARARLRRYWRDPSASSSPAARRGSATSPHALTMGTTSSARRSSRGNLARANLLDRLREPVGRPDDLVFDGTSLVSRAGRGPRPGVGVRGGPRLLDEDARCGDVRAELHAPSSVRIGSSARSVLGWRNYFPQGRSVHKAVVGLISGGIDISVSPHRRRRRSASENSSACGAFALPRPGSPRRPQPRSRGTRDRPRDSPSSPVGSRPTSGSVKPSSDGRPFCASRGEPPGRVSGTLLMASRTTRAIAALPATRASPGCGYCTLYGDNSGGVGCDLDVPKYDDLHHACGAT